MGVSTSTVMWIVIFVIGLISIAALIISIIEMNKPTYSGLKGGMIYLTGTQPVQDSNSTLVNFDKTQYMTPGIVSHVTSIQVTSTGICNIGASVFWDDASQTASTLRIMYIVKTRSSVTTILTQVTGSNTPGFYTGQTATASDYALPGDSYGVLVVQTSGGSLNLTNGEVSRSGQSTYPALWVTTG